MNDHDDEFDARLAELFRREHTHVHAEPFATATLRAIAAEHRRAGLRTVLLQAAALIVLILAAPRLIAVTVWVSARLDDVFAVVSAWLASPYGMAVALLAVLAGFMARRPLAATVTKWARMRPRF